MSTPETTTTAADAPEAPQWYTMTNANSTQGLIADERTGANIAVSYDPKHAQLIASAPKLLAVLRLLVNEIDSQLSPESYGEVANECSLDLAKETIAEAQQEIE